jgi:hypothetical protein
MVVVMVSGRWSRLPSPPSPPPPTPPPTPPPAGALPTVGSEPPLPARDLASSSDTTQWQRPHCDATSKKRASGMVVDVADDGSCGDGSRLLCDTRIAIAGLFADSDDCGVEQDDPVGVTLDPEPRRPRLDIHPLKRCSARATPDDDDDAGESAPLLRVAVLPAGE